VHHAFRTQIAAGAEGPAGWKALETAFPDNPEVLFGMSQDPRAAPEDAVREALLRRVLHLDPDHSGGTVALAEFLRVRGRAEESRELLLEFLARVPESRSGRVAFGETLEQLGRTAEARGAYLEGISAPWAQITSPVLLAAGLGLLRLREYDTLSRRLESAMRERPPDPAVYQLLARVLEHTEGEEAAERGLRDGLKACGPRPSLLYALGDLLRRLDRRHEAEGLMKALIEHHPGSPWGYRGLGDLFVDTDSVKALELYARAIERDPVTPIPGVEYLQGLTKLRAGEPTPARMHFERAAAYEPSNARVWCDLGAAYFREGRLEAALRATERALALRPRHPGFLHNLAVYHAERFRRRPWQHPLSAWYAWRFGRRAERSEAGAWRRDLWEPAPDTGPNRGAPSREAPPGG
jgi:tetratricopeptide (TPR) repeat protein